MSKKHNKMPSVNILGHHVLTDRDLDPKNIKFYCSTSSLTSSSAACSQATSFSGSNVSSMYGKSFHLAYTLDVSELFTRNEVIFISGNSPNSFFARLPQSCWQFPQYVFPVLLKPPGMYLELDSEASLKVTLWRFF